MPNSLFRAASLLVFASGVVTAQVPRQQGSVPLRNWAAPLYWQPNQAESLGKARPQIQFSSNAVSTDALTFVAITPCRLVDTRGATAGFMGVAPFNGPAIAAAGTLSIPVQSPSQTTTSAPAPCGAIPPIAEAYSFSVTVVPVAGAVDYISVWPSGGTQPFVSTLDDPQGAIVASAAIIGAGTIFGGVNIYNAGPSAANVVIDMNGYFAPPSDLNGNTAIGGGALSSNSGGGGNTATGVDSLTNNTTGNNNTATGAGSLASNTTGSGNTSAGTGSLSANTGGSANTAMGFDALSFNTTGANNTADGTAALLHNTSGANNVAVGAGALQPETTGSFNTAVGVGALGNSVFGSNNIAIGYQAGVNIPNDSGDNIHIGNTGTDSDGGLIRIGTDQSSTFIAGINGATPAVSNSLVCVDANGQLGTVGCTIPMSVQIQLNDAQQQTARIERLQEQNRKLEDRLATLETILSGEAPRGPLSLPQLAWFGVMKNRAVPLYSQPAGIHTSGDSGR